MVKLVMAGGLATATAGLLVSAAANSDAGASRPTSKEFTMDPIGWVHKQEGSVCIEVDRRFEDALMGLEDFSHVWVFWWFDRNDTPGNRGILQVHPRGDARNPLTGVFATRAPVRPNLVALTLCPIISVEQNRIEIVKIDAFDGTPVVDLKPYLPALDRPVQIIIGPGQSVQRSEGEGLPALEAGGKKTLISLSPELSVNRFFVEEDSPDGCTLNTAPAFLVGDEGNLPAIGQSEL